MNSFDAGLLHWLNQFAGRWPTFDFLVAKVSNSVMLKGEGLMLVLWWYWFAPSKPARKNHEIIVSTILSAAAAIAVARLLAHFLPFRHRPAFNPDFHFLSPFTDAKEQLRDWSAFPSDHAMLFSAMATGLLFISRRIGAAVWAYWVIVIGLPRAYLGLHHPTDLIAGAVLGGVLAALGARAGNRERLARAPLAWHDAHPASFYACFFLFSFQLSTMFDEAKGILHGLLQLARHSQ